MSLRPIAIGIAALLSQVPAAASPIPSQTPDFLPLPKKVEMKEGAFALDASTVLTCNNRGVHETGSPLLGEHLELLAEELRVVTGLQLKVEVPGGGLSNGTAPEPRARAGAITIEFMGGMNNEHSKRIGGLAPGTPRAYSGGDWENTQYSLNVKPDSIVISAHTYAGIANGTSTLLQAIQMAGDRATVPCMSIEDDPASDYRSVMIDVARSPHSIGVIKDVVRFARLLKLRHVQLHLTDNQYFAFPFPPVTDHIENNPAWDLDELKELVHYAEVRGVILVPEIDLPGHSRRLIESGYLPGAKNDRDVADAAHAERLLALIDAVIDTFDSSPYFHIGGDESGAGSELVPFLERVNRHVRKRGRRLIVWEGFHGAPTKALPATGPDRVIVAAWESSYNAPWDLLDAGYTLINASWRPLYVVGGDSLVHPGSGGGRKWDPSEMTIWNKDRFMHWEPGRAVFEDRGPKDTNKDDGIWDVPSAEQRRQIIGGQVSVWEQRESSVIRSLRQRLPVLADRLWAGPGPSTEDVLRRARSVDERLFGLVQPIDVQIDGLVSGPLDAIAPNYPGETATVRLVNRTRLPGKIMWSAEPFRGRMDWIDFKPPADPALGGTVYAGPIEMKGGFSLRARLVDEAGRAHGAGTWAEALNWPQRVRVTTYDIGRRPHPTVPDFDALPEGAKTGEGTLPMIRGPITHVRVAGQRLEASLVAPGSGAFRLGLKTQSGRASLWVDLDGDGVFAAEERLIQDTPTSEERLFAEDVNLDAGKGYAIRIDHATALPRPVLIMTIEGPGTGGMKEASPFLAPLE